MEVEVGEKPGIFWAKETGASRGLHAHATQKPIRDNVWVSAEFR